MPETVEIEDTDEELTNLLDELQNELDDDGQPEPAPEQVPEPVTAPQSAVPTPPSTPPPSSDDQDLLNSLRGLAGSFVGTIGQIIQNHQEDRHKLDDVIETLELVVKGNGKIPQIYIEQWVAAVRTRVESNTSMTKVTDSISRLLAAVKKHDIVAPNVDKEDASWDDILNQKDPEDDE